MSNEIRDGRLAFELEEMQRLTTDSSMIDFEPNDDHLPDEYMVRFRCRGLAKQDRHSDFHVVHIYLPADYPREPPQVRFKTPIFHPNIKALLDDDAELERLAGAVGGQRNLARLYATEPRFRDMLDAHVCLDVLQLNWSPDYTLYDVCLELGAMIQYQRFNVEDPLNHEAAKWAEEAQTQPGLLPIDRRDLRDRLQVAAMQSSTTVDIRILEKEKL